MTATSPLFWPSPDGRAPLAHRLVMILCALASWLQAVVVLATGNDGAGAVAVILAILTSNAVLAAMNHRRRIVLVASLAALILVNLGVHLSRFRPASTSTVDVASSWLLQMHHPGSFATLEQSADRPDAVRVRIERAEVPTPWHVQLNEAGVSVHAGASYVLSFRARADASRRASYGVSMAHPPWDGLGFYRDVEIGPEWRNFSDTFVPTTTDSNARIHFDLGASVASVELERVVLRRLPTGEVVAPVDFPRDEPQGVETDLGRAGT
jgi:hypothetical protein